MLNIIAAVADNGVIGQKNGLPFRLKDDLKRFKEKTSGHPVVSGKTTYFSLPAKFRPLPGRENIVLTHHPETIEKERVTIATDFETVANRGKSEEIWIMGGAEVYRQALPFAQEMHLTRVHASVEGDVHFPEWDPEEWNLVSSERHEADEDNEFPFTWEKYVRRYRFIEMANCRTGEQRRVMQEILDTGVCPFCPENLQRWHLKPILWSGKHWVVSENMWPYPNTRVHLMLFLKTHAEGPADMPEGAFEEILTVMRWAEKEFGIKGGGLYMRFGECLWTGGTVRHIHAHIAAKAALDTEPPKFYL